MAVRSLLAVSLSAFAALGSTGAPQATPAPTSAYVAPPGSGALFLVSGHGWGHGVGMGQWGAQGYALQGETYQQILAAYYPGTSLGRTSVRKIRVLLADGSKRLTVYSAKAVTVVDGKGAKHTLPAGSTTFTPTLRLAGSGRQTRPLPPPLTFAPARGATLTLGRAYRGRIRVDVVSGKLRAIDVLPLQQYLWGVVPSEMPSTWLSAALEAQAIASRSYAIASRRVAAPFDVYADTRSQAYLGVSAETPEATAAVNDTVGQVVLYGGSVATTVFSSSTGGWTQSAADAWGGAGTPYLQSVRDPGDAISPWHDWGPLPFTGAALAQELGLAGKVVDATVQRNSSRRVADLDTVSRAHGHQTSTTLGGGTIATKLGLRSTWFTVGVLSLQPPAPNRVVTYGSSVDLSGIARGVRGVLLEERTREEPWTQIETLTPARKTGALAITVQPTLTTDYRLATSAAAAAFVRIRLAPQVTLTSATQDSVSGSELPALPGARVLVEQQLTEGSQAWTTVAEGAVDDSGDFTVPVGLQPGSVRVVVAPGNGWWPGASSAATVQ